MKWCDMKKLILFILLVSIMGQSAQAEIRHSQMNTIRVFVQSLSIANVHFIETQNQVWPTCPTNRAYIDPADKELIAKALTAETNSRSVSVFYDDAAPPRIAAPHNVGTCKVLSIW